jgi:uncharacterized protein YecE (DUF72 family)
MLFAGSILDRTPGRTYTATLRFAELSLRAPLPRPQTLSAWRAQLPDGFALSLRAPKDAIVSPRGPLRIDAALETSLAWTLDAAKALDVRAVVFATPADFAPGARARELLTAYVARLPKVEGRHYVWAPRGVWEPEDTEPLCAELGIVRAFDPLETPRPTGPFVYAEMRALGHRKSFSPAVLQDALEVISSEDFEEAFVTIDSERSFIIAKRLIAIAAEQGLADGVARSSDPGEEHDGEEEDEDLDDEDEDDEDEDELDDDES